MIPVLAVVDPAAARQALIERFGFAAEPDGGLRLGGQPILLCDAAAPPEGMLDFPLDHLALRVDDVDAVQATLTARGGQLSAAFTPDGPREIPEFFDHGVRYVFFDGPEGTPFEFCRPRLGGAQALGHDHFGMRTGNLDGLEARVLALGAEPVARYQLGTGDTAVNVRFLRLGEDVFELFDEPAPARQAAGTGWIGLMP